MNNKPEVLAPGGGALTYPILERTHMNKTLALIDENLSGQNFSIQNLPKIRVPAGGAMTFRVETAAGEESLRELAGVAVAKRQARAFWKKIYGSGSGKKPPDCTSIDGYTGTGDPGGECAACPWSQFGTAVNPDGSQGAGQACKSIAQVLFLLPGALLPHLLSVPPTSSKNFSQYTLALLTAGAAYWHATTRLSIERATSTGGIEYGRIVFRMGRLLEPAEQQILEPYHQKMKELLKPSVVDATAYEIIEDERPERHEPASEPVEQGVSDPDIPF